MSPKAVEHGSAEARVLAARGFLRAHAQSSLLVISTDRAAGDALVRGVIAEGETAALGWHRVTIDQLAGRLASRELAQRGCVPIAGPAIDALCARLLHRAPEHSLGRLQAVVDRPGLPRALASTISELALADLSPDEVRVEAPDLASLYAAYRAELPSLGLADRAMVFEAATHAAKSNDPSHPWVGIPVLLLDLRLRSALEADLIAALIERSAESFITLVDGDVRTRALLLDRVEISVDSKPDPAPAGSTLHALQRSLFEPSIRTDVDDSSVELFSAPGESRECIEIARRILASAQRGVRFDRIAVLLRAPDLYRVHLAEAFRRAGIPAHFSRGARRPDPAGRAFLALLACRAEGLSARAFGEYLSLGVVPDADADGAPPSPPPSRDRFVPADEDLVAHAGDPFDEERETIDPTVGDEDYEEDAPVRAGTLRAPRRWEQLIVDAAVIGGRDRWARRLAGLQAATEYAKAAIDARDPDGPESRALDRRMAELTSLRDFALPVIDALANLPDRAKWGDWIDTLSALATLAVRRPERVLSTLSLLAPMADVGPVDLAEIRAVLTPRLRDEITRPEDSADRIGKVVVCAIDEARGRALDVVFVPGLAEKVFPAKVIEDPVLLDASRARISRQLTQRTDRAADERLLLRIAVGAARQRLIASIPRLDVERSRPRVASFYALEIARAATGRLPSYEELGQRAELHGSARFGWPAPSDPTQAIDTAEHDLAVLAGLIDLPSSERAGRAAYLLAASPILARALRMRWARWDPKKKWRPQDGLVDPGDAVRAILGEHALAHRAYSATALESYALCPYKFFLRTIVRLEAREVPEPLEQLDPAQRGTLIHDAQFRFLSRLREIDELPITADNLELASKELDRTLDEVAAHHREELAPAIPKIWDDTIESARRDLREWLHRTAADVGWTPTHFELAFGIPTGDERDAASRADPVPLSGVGIRLRGAIDLVEKKNDALRATDYKTGSAWVKGRSPRIQGGEKLQPLLYALALEGLFPGERVWGGRLFYCTEKGRYTVVDVPLDDEGRAAIDTVARTVDEAVRTGFLPPAPQERVCSFCDYLSLCGPHERRRSQRKEAQRLVPLEALRRMP